MQARRLFAQWDVLYAKGCETVVALQLGDLHRSRNRAGDYSRYQPSLGQEYIEESAPFHRRLTRVLNRFKLGEGAEPISWSYPLTCR
jgi:hypothetical protein